MITIADTDIEAYLKTLFQKDIQLYLNNKIWREGKMLLFKQSGYFIEFIIQSPKKQERFEVPIPFAVYQDQSTIYFDYRIKTLTNNNDFLVSLINLIQPNIKSKFYDTTLSIKVG